MIYITPVHRQWKEVSLGVQSIMFKSHTKFPAMHAHLVEVQRSHMAFDATTAVRDKEMVEKFLSMINSRSYAR